MASFSFASTQNVQGWDYIAKEQNQIDWTSLKKKKVLLFLNSQCPCSQSHFDHLNQLQKDNPQFQFVGFHSNKLIERGDAQKYFDKYKIDFPIFEDKELVYADRFKALKTPHVFVLDESENLLFQGGTTNSRSFKKASKFFLKTALNEINSGKKVSNAHARALGCYINR